MNRIAFAACASLLTSLCLVAAPGNAPAYQLIEAEGSDGTYCSGGFLDCGDDAIFARWFTTIVPFWVNANAAADAADPGLSQSEIDNCAQACYQSWEDVPTAIIRFSYGGETSARIAGLDQTNTLVFYNPALDAGSCVGSMGAPSGLLAITILTEVAETGRITDADVVFDTADTWDWNTSCAVYDLQSVLTHEYGHSIGIHHTDLPAGGITTRPTMYAFYACDPGVASLRSLEPDDEAAVSCLYPELPTVLLIDQTGSMCTGNRMPDTQDAANDFIDEFADNTIAVAAFADQETSPCGGYPSCLDRPGYQLLQNYTTSTPLLHTAVNSTYPCGTTPLWESTCCAISKAQEMEPSNLLIITDTGENSSDGTCGCTTFADVLALALTTQVAVYVVDITSYFGALASPGPVVTDDRPPMEPQDDSTDLATLAARTGGLYMSASSPPELAAAMQSVSQHMLYYGKERQHPTDCDPGPFPLDVLQQYTPDCSPNSPYLGQQISVEVQVAAKRGTFDPNAEYVQDCSAGMRVVVDTAPPSTIGDIVLISGLVSESGGELQISPVFEYAVRRSDPMPGLPIVDPALGRSCEQIGSLMRVRGYVGGPPSGGYFPLISALGTREPEKLAVFIDPDTGIDPGMFHEGDYYVITGILARGPGDNQLMPRGLYDITGGSTGIHGGSPAEGEAPTRIAAVHPNPTRGGTEIGYSIAQRGRVDLRVIDVQGRRVRTLVAEDQLAGAHSAFWDGRNERGSMAASGVYYVRLMGPDGTSEARRLLLTR